MHYVVIIYTDVSQILLKDCNLKACHENFIMVFFKENPKTISYQTDNATQYFECWIVLIRKLFPLWLHPEKLFCKETLQHKYRMPAEHVT